MTGKKHIILNAFDMGSSGHQAPGLWKHPKDRSNDFDKLEYWTNLAKLLEKGKFNALFIADVLGGYDVYEGNLDAALKSGAQVPLIEPGSLIPAMAAVTDHLAFAVTFSTISEAPFHFARRLATIDELSKGRVGWNIVSSYLESAATNLLNGEPLPPHDERYARAEEYLDVVYKLFLSSWRDDAVVLDKENGIFTDPERVRKINHDGNWFKVPGPNIFRPSQHQRLPVILQAGTSRAGKEFAAKHAEAVFINSFTPEDLKAKIHDIKTIAKEKFGREEDSIKFLNLLTIVVGETKQDALEKFKDYSKYGDLDGSQALFGGWTGIDLSEYDYDEELTNVESNAIRAAVNNWTKRSPGDPPNLKKTRRYVAEKITVGGLGPVIIGDAQSVADELERWVEISGVDGFNLTYTISPGSFEDIVELLVPELQKRGLVWDDYPDDVSTYRESLFGTKGPDPKFVRPSHPAYKLRWKEGESKEDFERRINI
ncbi:FMN-dependent oxidoreductase [Yamadazyma tenuis]|uniref:Nitrilotriacetate monooxygenase component A/pristinamycin IIA synthase subunit A n=1 Tax=Candida tenuis (strain ATCC 10573 / BCRC 21748 / CBS 615 / JCM 9827 / NBRC 10315 / NRRL Y-1498 / VKM Y-70) TaxID=590646 RepID=G3B1X4_CANTC|nr:Nitrilotriacetate monooxygenase component A/pristinamycin IIA synthase subunit A [Yamadazyma tenuis ATCC 10573]EGV64552.1 Nitrilotriacetate monooxygenase component A/pristinamycin IIA synthase subunit A [Yamadazyma tenuis ATCC 10573]WEJ97315.1 FMN-dependent oxidoreductase [Yamadazyma tenuis]